MSLWYFAGCVLCKKSVTNSELLHLTLMHISLFFLIYDCVVTAELLIHSGHYVDVETSKVECPIHSSYPLKEAFHRKLNKVIKEKQSLLGGRKQWRV